MTTIQIENANHSVMRPAEKLRVIDCVADCVWFAVPEPTEWQRIRNQINAAMILTRADFVKRALLFIGLCIRDFG